MAKHVGIVVCNAEGAALCYRIFCKEAAITMGEHIHPEVSMHTYPLGIHERHNFRKLGTGCRVDAQVRSKIGPYRGPIAICPDNTIHQAFDLV